MEVGGFSAAYGPDKPEEPLDMTKFHPNNTYRYGVTKVPKAILEACSLISAPETIVINISSFSTRMELHRLKEATNFDLTMSPYLATSNQSLSYLSSAKFPPEVAVSFHGGPKKDLILV